MAILRSSNPALSEKIFGKSIEQSTQETMTVRGSIQKFGFLMLMVIVGAYYTWNLAEMRPNTMMTMMMVGVFGGFITAMAIIFKPNWAGYLSPLYGLLEGFFIGAISVIINNAFAEKYPGIVIQAVGLTFGVAVAMFLLYSFKIIKATQKFRSVVIASTMGIGLFYLISMVLRLFHVDLPFMYNSSALGISISLFVVAIAALNLILDFDMIERGAEMGAPKYMEWYGAFGLLVTIVWLYIEILKLLSRLGNRN